MALALDYSPEKIAAAWPYLTPEERAEVEALVNDPPIPNLALKEFVWEGTGGFDVTLGTVFLWR
ncbi:MAG: hypothetical protein IAE79_26075 [Anaerolinea sp.]|nr:hypothetical protein [Anaerolinea sp.]